MMSIKHCSGNLSIIISYQDALLLLPDANSETTRKALLRFYDNSCENSLVERQGQVKAFKKVFGESRMNFFSEGSNLEENDNFTDDILQK